MTLEHLNQIVADLIPPGTIVAFGGEVLPSGWEFCNGQPVDSNEAKYQRLYKAIGTGWGGSGTPIFHLPDLRGRFLRGVSGTVDVDPEKDKRDPARPADPVMSNQGNSGNRVGSTQPQSFLAHNHSYSGKKAQASGGGGFWGFDFDNNSGPIGSNNYLMSTVGGTETRPVNTNVHFIIKL
jgi:hypothetical protein